MTALDIKINTLDDNDPTWPDIVKDGRAVIMGNLQAAAILEEGTAGGNSSIALRIELPTGDIVIAQTTGGIIKMLHGALLGAEARFADLKNGRR